MTKPVNLNNKHIYLCCQPFSFCFFASSWFFSGESIGAKKMGWYDGSRLSELTGSPTEDQLFVQLKVVPIRLRLEAVRLPSLIAVARPLPHPPSLSRKIGQSDGT